MPSDAAQYLAFIGFGDIAVMAPIYPARQRTPLLISGDHSARLLPRLQRLGMSARPMPGAVGAVGAASTVKMLRSVVIKAMEALSAECVLAELGIGNEMARATTVCQQRIGDLQIRDGSTDLAQQADEILERLGGPSSCKHS